MYTYMNLIETPCSVGRGTSTGPWPFPLSLHRGRATAGERNWKYQICVLRYAWEPSRPQGTTHHAVAARILGTDETPEAYYDFHVCC